MTIRSVMMALPLLVFGWLVTLTAVTVLADEAPAYVVLFPRAGFVESLPEGVSIIAANGFSITLAANRPALVRTLYGQGALIVLPAGLSGCSRIQNGPGLVTFG
jgi:hypothetical protein